MSVLCFVLSLNCLFFHLADKSVPITSAYNIDIKDLQENFDCIVEELETTDVIDPLLEYYVISLDDHDDLLYLKKTRKEKNSHLIHTLIGKKSDSWIPGFVFVLDHTKHSGLLSVIQHKGKRVLPSKFEQKQSFVLSNLCKVVFQV